MSRRFLVRMPRAEARHLAGTSRPWPPVPGGPAVPGPCLAAVPGGQRPVRGPFAPDRHGLAPPGRVEYLGGGLVRLDEAALTSLAELAPDDDFRVTFEEGGPVLTVGTDRYAAREEALGEPP
jgi:hypothetical protein